VLGLELVERVQHLAGLGRRELAGEHVGCRTVEHRPCGPLDVEAMLLDAVADGVDVAAPEPPGHGEPEGRRRRG
jgi:hypothetical protein